MRLCTTRRTSLASAATAAWLTACVAPTSAAPDNAAASATPSPAPARASNTVPTSTTGAAAVVVRRSRLGRIACFEPGLEDADGDPVTCEISAAAAVGREVLLFNDKPVPGPGRAAIFFVDPDATPPRPRPVDDATLQTFRKWEDAEPGPDGDVLATTGFDRIRPGDAKWDGFNALVHWRPGASPLVVGASERDGVISSRTLRERFGGSLADGRFPKGPPYFKIEGLARRTDGRVLFGIRELGQTHEELAFSIIILEARDLDAVSRDGVRRRWSFDAGSDARVDDRPLGLSGLTWDAARDGLWMTTSWETGESDEDLGGYLWWLSASDLDDGGPPHLAVSPEGGPLIFAHKPEAITVLHDGRLFVAHDDDRVTGRDAATITDAVHQFSRGLHEAAYELLVPVP